MPSTRPPTPALETVTYPEDCRDHDQWLTWKPTDNDRKVPRAPYTYPDWPERYVDAQNPAVWTDFATAQDWIETLSSGFELAYVIRNRDEYPDEDLVVIDYDDARDPETSAIHPVVHEHLQTAGSYADVSPSATGVHILCRGQLPDDVTTVADDLPPHDAFPDASIEVYDSARFVAMSGQYLVGTPTETQPAQAFIDDLVDAFTTPQPQADTSPEVPPPHREQRSPSVSTIDIEDVYRAIETTRPSEIRLNSPVTETRSDGTKSRNPCWTSSDSGTRLAEMDDGWIYRNGLVVLDALQVVALEERIVTTAGDYPSGKDFWQAVDELRARGAHIPEYEADPGREVASNQPAPSSSPTSGQSLRYLHRELRTKTIERNQLREELVSLRRELAARIRDVRS
jgi:putative DNA primase/helicase